MSSCFCTGACRVPGGRCSSMNPVTTPSISEYVEWLKNYRRRFVNPRKNIPIIPKLPDDYPGPHPNEPWAICGECGMELRGVMGYVCPNSRCPVFPRVYY